MRATTLKLACWLVGCLLLVACASDDDATVPEDVYTPPDTMGDVVVPHDIALAPDAPTKPDVDPDPDVVDPDPEVVDPDPEVVDPDPEVVEPDPEVVEPDPEVVEPDPEVVDPDPCPGAPGCPCVEDFDCDETPCIETLDGLFCAEPCLDQDDCPEGWLCLDIAPEGEDPFGICVDPFARLCQPCITDDDCLPRDGGFEGVHACLEHGPSGSYCGIPCDIDADIDECPMNYVCITLEEHPDTPTQCVPEVYDTCPCLDEFVDRGATTICYVENEHGRCEAERLCDEECPARVPAPETCNGIDDNCNGLTDEGTEEECYPFYCDSEAGECNTACETVADCQPGYAACEEGVCLKDLGYTCELGAECASSFCVDSVCCESLCDGVCESCGLPGHLGVCAAVPEGEDPAEECPAEDPETCGRVGGCSGERSCALYPDDTVCADAYCVDPATSASGLCDGEGNCDIVEVDCAPFMCDTDTGECMAACETTDDCEAGYTCIDGACLKSLGLSCEAAVECASGFCTDGVCCESLCDEICEFCALPEQLGLCLAVPMDEDPRNDCPAQDPETCGFIGGCSGERTCLFHDAGIFCAEPYCAADTLALLAGECDGEGTCVQLEDNCAPFRCDVEAGACLTWCETDEDCELGADCEEGVCQRTAGTACTFDEECATGFCAHGVCCLEACDGVCERCDFEDSLGECRPVPEGEDPYDECTDEGIESCGQTGVCSGERSCALYPAGELCQPARCEAFWARGESFCNGEGDCVATSIENCYPYRCIADTDECYESCDTNAQCYINYACAPDGVCKLVQGQECVDDDQCVSGFCTDGVCCDDRCHGICESCALPGRAGFCDALPEGTPAPEDCPMESVSTCGRNGLCSGERSCALYPSGTECQAATCTGDVASQLAYLCDGEGTCESQGIEECMPYTCSPTTGLCRTTCSSAAHCGPGYGCHAATGVCLRRSGESCIEDADCLSGACCDNTCRDILTDPSNCGTCGHVCLNPNGTTSCVSGACNPICDPLWGNCDGNPDGGCEQPLTTLTHCGDCFTPCELPNASETCASGDCEVDSCNLGYGNCDTNDATGCETDLTASPNTCPDATNLGTICGNTTCGFLCPSSNWEVLATVNGRGGAWYTAELDDCTTICTDNIRGRITLNVPSGADYDLYVYSACGSLWESSRSGMGATERVTVSRNDAFGSNSSYRVWIEVRHNAGESCGDWTLTFEGRDC